MSRTDDRVLACTFDEAFYRDRYADDLDGADCLEHFVNVGVARGFMANPLFDPVLYKIRNPEARATHAWQHYQRFGLGARHCGGLQSVFPDILPELYARHITDVDELALGREQAMDLCREGALTFEWQGETYRFHHPNPAFFFDRIADDRPFAFGRIPHGFWDSIFVVATTADRIARDPRASFANGDECWSLAARLCFERWDKMGAFSENFLREVMADIRRPDADEGLFTGTAFKGFPTLDAGVFPESPPGQANLDRFQVFASFFQADDVLFDATLWKRWAAGGALKDFPDLCRNHPIVLVGPDRLKDLGERWRLTDFLHVSIPPANTHLRRRLVLERCSAALDQQLGSSRHPIVLFQCGGSLAYWFMRRLRARRPEVFYLDLGQTLDCWFFDIERPVTATWVKVYRNHVVENCELTDFYAGLQSATREASSD